MIQAVTAGLLTTQRDVRAFIETPYFLATVMIFSTTSKFASDQYVRRNDSKCLKSGENRLPGSDSKCRSCPSSRPPARGENAIIPKPYSSADRKNLALRVSGQQVVSALIAIEQTRP